jgi:hypothetical protein
LLINAENKLNLAIKNTKVILDYYLFHLAHPFHWDFSLSNIRCRCMWDCLIISTVMTKPSEDIAIYCKSSTHIPSQVTGIGLVLCALCTFQSEFKHHPSQFRSSLFIDYVSIVFLFFFLLISIDIVSTFLVVSFLHSVTSFSDRLLVNALAELNWYVVHITRFCIIFKRLFL